MCPITSEKSVLVNGELACDKSTKIPAEIESTGAQSFMHELVRVGRYGRTWRDAGKQRRVDTITCTAQGRNFTYVLNSFSVIIPHTSMVFYVLQALPMHG
jgi:hypothetical protein